jgi:hypothetical protein
MSQQQGLVLSSVFQNTLSKATGLYIQSKAMLAPDRPQDIRGMRDAVREDLARVRQEATQDYLAAAGDIEALGAELGAADRVLEQLEGVLLNFRDKLGGIKEEMAGLQDRAARINLALRHKREVSESLSAFVDSAILEPGLAKCILGGELDLNYGDQLQILGRKIAHLRNNPTNSKAAREIQPELEKLASAASERVRDHMLERLTLLRRQKSPIPVLQKELLLPTRGLLQFVREHNLPVFTAICNGYRDALCKHYTGQFKTYFQETFKLQSHLYPRGYALLFDGAADKKVQAASARGQRVVALGRREAVLEEKDEDLILCHVAAQKGAKYLPEEVFKSCNQVLVEIVLKEVEFLAEWLGMKPEPVWDLFGAEFRPAMNLLNDLMRAMLEQTHDPYAILLLILLTRRARAKFEARALKAVCYLYEQLDILLWPRLEDTVEAVIKTLEPRPLKASLRQPAVESFHLLFEGLYGLFVHFEDNKMLAVRLERLRTAFLAFVRGACEGESPLVAEYGALHSLGLMQAVLRKAIRLKVQKELVEVQSGLEKEISRHGDELVSLYLREQFKDLDKFSRANAVDIEAEGKALKPVESKVLEGLVEGFGRAWAKAAADFHKEAQGQLTPEVLQQVSGRYLGAVVNLYGGLHRYLKNNCQTLTGGLLQPHVLMKELKKKLGE